MMEGVTVHPLKHIVVPKGDIYHALKSTDEGYVGFGEAYFSQNRVQPKAGNAITA